MTKKITLLSIVLLIATLGYAQQAKRNRHHSAIAVEKYVTSNAKNKRYHSKHLLLYEKNHIKKSFMKHKSSISNAHTLDSLIFYNWAGSGWLLFSKELYTYNANGDIATAIYYDTEYNSKMKTEFLYDAGDYLMSETDFVWDENSSQWIEDYKVEYTYDANGNQISETYSYWMESQWIYEDKYEATYDANGKLILEIEYFWVSGQWTNSLKLEHTYDADGNRTSRIIFMWNESANQWVEYYKTDYTYDTNNYLTLSETFLWTTSSNQWLYYLKNEYTYDANGNQMTDIYSTWDQNTVQWEYSYKKEYSYDANGNRTSKIKYNWSDNASEWKNDEKTDFSYDLSINLADLIMPYWRYADAFYSNMYLEEINYTWDETNTEWDPGLKVNAYYSESSIGVNELCINNLTLYPNPASGIVNIDFVTRQGETVFELFDMQGKNLISRIVSANKEINLEHLNSGIYIYSITTDGKVENGKLIIR